MKRIITLTLTSCLLIGLRSTTDAQIVRNECDSVNEQLSAKFRFLGSWDEQGRADYLENERDTVPSSLIDYVETTLPESISIVDPNTGLFDPEAQLNTILTDSADVWVTYVFEGAGYNNVMGFYTYPKGAAPSTVYDLDSLVILFPNVSDPSIVQAGDKVHLGKFPPNTVIGYFLLADGWVGDSICLPNYMVFSDKNLNVHTSEVYRQHTILLQDGISNKILLGFEDLPRPESDDDFNDVMFYITADPNVIDTTNIHQIPTAKIDGDTVLCNAEAPAQVQIDLTGKGPWAITYFDGTDTVSVENILTSPYIFETTVKDTITLTSVKNPKGYGSFSGEAIIQVAYTGVRMADQGFACEGEENGRIRVDFDGFGPWNLSYTDGNEEIEVNGITENVYYIEGKLGEEYTLISVSDKYCDAPASGSATIVTKPAPTAILTGSTIICDDNYIAELNLELTGEAPYVVAVEVNGVTDTLYVNEGETTVGVTKPGTYKLIYVEDPYCAGSASGTAEVVSPVYPTASISGSTQICGDVAGKLLVNLTGKSPWNIVYTDAFSEFAVSSTENTMEIEVSAAGIYELVSVEDAFCRGTVDGSASITVFDVPTAVLSGPSVICGGNPALLNIALTGSGPWNIDYTDGSQVYSSNANTANHEISVENTGTYTLLAVEDAQCIGTVEGSVDVEEKETPTALISGNGSICTDDESVELTIELTGAAPWTVLYTDGSTETTLEIVESPYIFTVSTPGTYEILSVTDAYCDGIGQGIAEVIDELDNLNGEIGSEDLVCFGETIEITISGVEEETISSFTSDGNGELRDLGAGKYEYVPADGESGIITFSLELTNNCGSKTIVKEITIQEELDASFETSPEVPYVESPVDFTPSNTGYDKYTWKFGDGNESENVLPSHEYVNAGVYTVELIVEKNGCDNSASAEIEVLGNKLLFVPSAFNPTAAHDENRVVKVYGTAVSSQDFHFRIVNRWGKTLYETQSWNEANQSGWDGLNYNTDEHQELNVFTYLLRGKFEDGERFELTGTVTLIK